MMTFAKLGFSVAMLAAFGFGYLTPGKVAYTNDAAEVQLPDGRELVVSFDSENGTFRIVVNKGKGVTPMTLECVRHEP